MRCLFSPGGAKPRQPDLHFKTSAQRAVHHNKDVVISLSSPHALSLVFSVLQSLLTGLMYYRPDDPIHYLEVCLQKARELGGPDRVRWDTFVGQEKKSLPPINGSQSRRSLFRNGEQQVRKRKLGVSDQ